MTATSEASACELPPFAREVLACRAEARARAEAGEWCRPECGWFSPRVCDRCGGEIAENATRAVLTGIVRLGGRAFPEAFNAHRKCLLSVVT